MSDETSFEHELSEKEPGERVPAPPLNTFYTLASSHQSKENNATPISQRAEVDRLNDDLELLRAERVVSHEEQEELADSKSKTRVHNPEPEDAFNQSNTEDVAEKSRQQKNEKAALYQLWLFLRKFPRFIRYIIYLVPGAALLLVPVLLGVFRFHGDRHAVGGTGGVELMWFGIWLEILWCSLWVSRMLTNLMPPLFHRLALIVGSINAHKWRDIGQRLELPTALFLWFLAILVSFRPTMDHHRVPSGSKDKVNLRWVKIVDKVVIALFVLAALNFVEKMLIQWIATSFHQRTYATRIENNKADIRQLVRLFEHAKSSRPENSAGFWKAEPDINGGFINADDNSNGSRPANGAMTPTMRMLHNNARQVLGHFGHVAGKVGNDLIGRKTTANHPRKIVSELLRNTASAQVLARHIYRSVVREDRETVHLEDLQLAFTSVEDAEAAFCMFDKDMNGDISMDEFEAVCNEIHLEKKAIAASLKDLDSVIQKLDKVFLFLIVLIAIVVFVSILSSSAAAGLASAGTSILGLAWMLQATAQEFLQSIIFVFIKHPFDVGDRITIYGSTGASLTGDDYYVTEISLLYTEFKKMQGHIVQAPNSLLNTLFILNQRRSNGLSDSIPLQMRFGTPPQLIDELKARMLDFVKMHKRDYQPNIITEMTTLGEVRSCTMNMVFFHKSNFQNELLRLNRHNKFVTELMYQMTCIGIEDPWRGQPGGSREYPVYWANLPQPKEQQGHQGHQGQQGQQGHEELRSPLSPQQPGIMKHSLSVRGERGVPNTEAAMGGFQDVFEKRRGQRDVQRMESIREKEKERKRRDEEGGPSRSSMASALHPSVSMGSQSRARIFARPRSRTLGHHSDAV